MQATFDLSKTVQKILAPAKINLLLLVRGRLKNGYHVINSVVSPITLYDDVDIEIRPSNNNLINISCDYSDELAVHITHCLSNEIQRTKVDRILKELNSDKNLAYRAAHAFFSVICPNHSFSVSIRILKRIPFQAGLGGGSSNAAAVLLALANAFNISKFSPEICNIASQLGSDILALLHGSMVFMHETGNKLIPLSFIDESALRFYQELVLIIAKPCVGVDTAKAYLSFGLEPSLEQSSITDMPFCIQGNELVANILKNLRLEINQAKYNEENELKKLTKNRQKGSSTSLIELEEGINLLDSFCNDFERVIYPYYEEINDIRDKFLSYGFEKTLLAGSGSSVVGFCSEKEVRAGLVKKLKELLGTNVFVTEAKLLVL